MERDERGKPLAMPSGSDVQMDEIEHVRLMLEERTQEFESLADLPAHERLEAIGREPGSTLAKIAALHLEDAMHRPNSDAYHALEDVASLAIKCMNGPLTEAEIWRLCYRLAYLVGYGIHVVRDESEASTQALEALENREREQRRKGGSRRWASIAPIKAYARQQWPTICYDDAGQRLSQAETTDKLREALLARPFPERDIPKWDTLKDWLKEWRSGSGYSDWRHLPLRLADCPATPPAAADDSPD